MASVFKKIFHIAKDDLETEVCRRMTERFAPTNTCPMTCQLSFQGNQLKSKLVNVSAGGVMLELDELPKFKVDDVVDLEFTLEDLSLHIQAEVKTILDEKKCGLAVVFSDGDALSIYRQLTIPIVVGGSLKQLNPDKVMQSEPGVEKSIYTGLYGSTLNIWREDIPEGAYKSFEFKMDDTTMVGNSKNFNLDFINPTSNDEVEDFKKYFKFLVPNIGANMPPAAIEFLNKFLK